MTILNLNINFYWDQGSGTGRSADIEFELLKATPPASNTTSTWSWSEISPFVAGSTDVDSCNQLKNYNVDARYAQNISKGDAVALVVRHVESYTAADGGGSTGATMTKSILYGTATMLTNVNT